MSEIVRNREISVSLNLITEQCCNCGTVFAMSEALVAQRRSDGGWFWCPSGHQQHYAQSTEDQLRASRAEAERLKAQIARERESANKERDGLLDELNGTRRSLAATKGQLTRARKRAIAGVCQFCNRHFANVERHVHSKHPGVDVEAPA